ncbi:hypothetical protein F5148DRAFT_1200841 [Russula earlei]|uniref:Uncharacterized protein n=1 Tax=Russula earlei TaxID=71964 RepID=A0ACC0U8K6_9AGAM|nr:hypothetical protein F5148DRAFT_1200841 [Russula earlei]
MSKGSVISKGLVILQTGWFVTQCIARGAQGLPITEIELVTVAFATLNLVMYLLWWNKPLNVGRGARVYKKRNAQRPTNDGHVDATSSVGFWGALRDAISDLPAAIARGPSTTVTGDNPWLIRVLLWPANKPFSIFLGEDDQSCTNLKRVQTFYPHGWVVGRMHFAVSIVTAVTLAFGAIHCVGWSFAFPLGIERTLWRVASVSIAVVPILFLLLVFASIPCNISDSVATTIAFLLLSLYILGRLTLLVLPFLCLRSLPPAAFRTVHWTSFIPHV